MQEKPAKRELWYLSPLRPEAAPSFHINTERNIWYDIGDGSSQSGTVIDFALRYYQTNSVAEALHHYTS